MSKTVAGRGFEPLKASAGDFTGRSLWPLGHPAIEPEKDNERVPQSSESLGAQSRSSGASSRVQRVRAQWRRLHEP